MKTWKIVAWLILFFPIGLYYMHMYARWPKKVLYSVSGVYSVIILSSLLSGGLYHLGFFMGVGLFVSSIGLVLADLHNRRNTNSSVFLIASSITLIVVSGLIVQTAPPQLRVASESGFGLYINEEKRIERQNLELAEEAVRRAEDG